MQRIQGRKLKTTHQSCSKCFPCQTESLSLLNSRDKVISLTEARQWLLSDPCSRFFWFRLRRWQRLYYIRSQMTRVWNTNATLMNVFRCIIKRNNANRYVFKINNFYPDVQKTNLFFGLNSMHSLRNEEMKMVCVNL